MPLVRISLARGKSAGYRRRVADAIHQALVETIGVPDLDRFQLISEHAPSDFIFAPSYLDIEHTPDLIMVQITISEGRTAELKKALYLRIADNLKAAVELRPQDVFVNLLEVRKENWSFGNGLAQYAAA
jgi:4-oxalocrotonate tautomerase